MQLGAPVFWHRIAIDEIDAVESSPQERRTKLAT